MAIDGKKIPPPEYDPKDVEFPEGFMQEWKIVAAFPQAKCHLCGEAADSLVPFCITCKATHGPGKWIVVEDLFDPPPRSGISGILFGAVSGGIIGLVLGYWWAWSAMGGAIQ